MMLFEVFFTSNSVYTHADITDFIGVKNTPMSIWATARGDPGEAGIAATPCKGDPVGRPVLKMGDPPDRPYRKSDGFYENSFGEHRGNRQRRLERHPLP
jgi:hypothetical protein